MGNLTVSKLHSSPRGLTLVLAAVNDLFAHLKGGFSWENVTRLNIMALATYGRKGVIAAGVPITLSCVLEGGEGALRGGALIHWNFGEWVETPRARS